MKTGKFIENLAKSLASRLQKALSSSSSGSSDQQEEVLHEITAQEQKQFPFETLLAATRDFHPKLKLGEGGFGPVYKVCGILTIRAYFSNRKVGVCECAFVIFVFAGLDLKKKK